jgi:hypothetical protein
MTTRPINADTVGSLLANTTNVLTIALGESWLGLLKKLEEQEEYIAQLEQSVSDWETLAGQQEDELRDLREERWGWTRGREAEVGAW